MLATVTKRVNSRLEANTSSKKLVPLEVGEKVNIVGLKFGEEYRGSSSWFIIDKGINITSLAVSPNLQGNRLSTLIDYFPQLWDIANNKIVKIGIFDSGVTKGSTLFGERVIQLNHDNSTITEGHGDYMTAIIAGSDFNKEYFGFLPNAQIFSYQASKRANKSIILEKDLKEALKQFVQNEVDLVNVSMVSNEEQDLFKTDTELQDILNECSRKGILIFASTGNQGSKTDNCIRNPARLETVFAIGGCNSINQKSATFDSGSNLWTGVNLLSPSDQIFDNSFFLENNLDGSGTSVSCAVAVGIFGIVKAGYSKIQNNSPPFNEYFKDVIEKMPSISIAAEKFKPDIDATSFKYLDFSTIKKILQI